MTREDMQRIGGNVIICVHKLLEEKRDPTPEETKNLFGAAIYVLAGIGDAILEIRDNSRTAEKDNPFGPGTRHHEKVGKE